jgi:hypothetical protein
MAITQVKSGLFANVESVDAPNQLTDVSCLGFPAKTWKNSESAGQAGSSLHGGLNRGGYPRGPGGRIIDFSFEEKFRTSDLFPVCILLAGSRKF